MMLPSMTARTATTSGRTEGACVALNAAVITARIGTNCMASRSFNELQVCAGAGCKSVTGLA
jgi:hypothetical protein